MFKRFHAALAALSLLALVPAAHADYVVKDAKKWEVEPERTASKFDIGYYGKLLEKAWREVAYVFGDSDQ